jgi:putative chitinase
MGLNRKVFFDAVRVKPFGGVLSQQTVEGCTRILDEWDGRRMTDLRWLAYMLATVLAECGKNMQPVREGFKATDALARSYVRGRGYKYAAEVNGQVYYGRGLVQLTWFENYRTMGKALGLDLVNNPDLALSPPIAVRIMFEGMTRGETGIGDFTRKSLEDYFNATGSDWVNARRIINGTDRAQEIAEYGKQFYAALRAAASSPVPQPPPPDIPAPKPTTPAKGVGWFAALLNLFKRKA